MALKSGVSVCTNFDTYSKKKLEIGVKLTIRTTALKNGTSAGPSKSYDGIRRNLNSIMKIEAGIRMAQKCLFQLDVLKSNKTHIIHPAVMLPRFPYIIIFINTKNIKANGMATRILFKNPDILDFHE